MESKQNKHMFINLIYIFLVKWFVLKPLVKLSYVINGKLIGKVRWYQKRFVLPVKWMWLHNITYKLTKYVAFINLLK